MPAQGTELLIGAARAEHITAFARIEAIASGVDDVVHAIEKQAEWKNDVEKARPEGGAVPIERAAKRHEVEESGSRPKAGTGDLDEKLCVRKKTEFCERFGVRLDGKTHSLKRI